MHACASLQVNGTEPVSNVRRACGVTNHMPNRLQACSSSTSHQWAPDLTGVPFTCEEFFWSFFWLWNATAFFVFGMGCSVIWQPAGWRCKGAQWGWGNYRLVSVRVIPCCFGNQPSQTLQYVGQWKYKHTIRRILPKDTQVRMVTTLALLIIIQNITNKL